MDTETPDIAPLRICDSAPDFSARSTAGDFILSDFRGKWLILFSHPADFTPVCTSEFVALAQAEDRFAEHDCALAGLSVDSLYSHFAWIRAIRDRFGVEVTFPIIEDPTMAIGRAYGMISSDDGDSATIRSTYFIDPAGIIRAITTYPANVGRSVDEMLRVLQALIAADRDDALAPANWHPGDPLLCAPDPVLSDIFSGAEPSGWFYKEKAPQ
ncbi:MAG: peroxiredoxin [Pontixanthobacter sp.]